LTTIDLSQNVDDFSVQGKNAPVKLHAMLFSQSIGDLNLKNQDEKNCVFGVVFVDECGNYATELGGGGARSH
jgi:hypothetical protein